MNLSRVFRSAPVYLTSALLLSSCDNRSNNNSNVQQAPQRPVAQQPVAAPPTAFGAPLIDKLPAARNPMISMQPLMPGLSWTYDIKVSGRPWVFRRLSHDTMHGVEYMGSEKSGPMNEWAGIGSRARFTVTDQTKQIAGEYGGPSTFYKIKTESFDNGKWSEINNGLYWGRVRTDVMSFAICEIRDLDGATKDFRSRV